MKAVIQDGVLLIPDGFGVVTSKIYQIGDYINIHHFPDEWVKILKTGENPLWDDYIVIRKI